MPHMPKFDPGPVIGIKIYRRDVVVVRSGVLHRGNNGIAPRRGEITMLSKKSRQRLAFVANNTRVVFKTMVTLTYPGQFSSDGKVVKEHLNKFLLWCRNRFATPSYLWFLEFQRRGAPHIHLLIDTPLSQDKVQRLGAYADVARKWYIVVGSGDVRHLKAGTRVERIRKKDGAARYCLKYAYKMRQKMVPDAYRNVGRFWGCSRDVPPKDVRMWPIDELSVRAVLSDWEYCPSADTLVYQTLYGCADKFRNYAGIRVYADLTNRRIDDKLVLSTSD